MKRLTKSTVLAIASLFLFVSIQAVQSEDTKAEKKAKRAAKAEAKKAEGKGAAKAERQRALPRFFGDLNLTEEQKTKVRATVEKYGPKIDDLQKQIEELRAKLNDETKSVLTAEQKARLEERIANAKGNRNKRGEAVGSRSPLKSGEIAEKLKAAKEKAEKAAEKGADKK